MQASNTQHSVCVEGRVDGTTRALFGSADLVDTLVHAIADSLAADARSAGGNMPPVSKGGVCTTMVGLSIDSDPATYGYHLRATLAQGGNKQRFDVERPDGERKDLPGLTGASKTAYVTQSIVLDLKEVGARIASTILGGRDHDDDSIDKP